MSASEPEPMDVERVLTGLNGALALQRRSVMQFATASGSLFGLEVQGAAERLWVFASEDLDDLRRLVEKITALGGDPGTEVAPTRWSADPQETFEC